MLKNYYEAREWLESFIPYTYSKENLGLERITYLLELLGNPQKKFKSILIGGTSGKGSTAFYLARGLQSSSQFTLPSSGQAVHSSRKLIAGENLSDNRQPTTDNLKIGLHVSPHLTYIGERMQIFQRVKGLKSERVKDREGPIPVERLVGLINEIKPVVEAIKRKQPHLTPSYFEILVAASFLYFAKVQVDVAVVEVGLGGRLDATNVLQPILTVITNVGLDHTDILGKTIEKIAREKAGIIKKGVPVVTGCPSTHSVRSGSSIPRYNSVSSTSGKALAVIEKVAKEKNALLITISTLKADDRAYYDLLRNIKAQIDDVNGGKFQVTDECFFLVNLALNQLGIRLSENQQGKVFSAHFEGRFEEIDDGIVIDGAHNRDKVRVLIKWVKNKFRESERVKELEKIILVCGFKKGKDWKGMLRLLINNLDIDRIYVTQFYAVTDTGPAPVKNGDGVNFFSAVEPEEIKRFIELESERVRDSKSQRGKELKSQRVKESLRFHSGQAKSESVKVKTFNNSQEAVWKVLRLRAGSSKLVLITGSLYLAGEARTLWYLPEFD